MFLVTSVPRSPASCRWPEMRSVPSGPAVPGSRPSWFVSMTTTLQQISRYNSQQPAEMASCCVAVEGENRARATKNGGCLRHPPDGHATLLPPTRKKNSIFRCKKCFKFMNHRRQVLNECLIPEHWVLMISLDNTTHTNQCLQPWTKWESQTPFSMTATQSGISPKSWTDVVVGISLS